MDREWIELILEAQRIGITIEEVKEFLELRLTEEDSLFITYHNEE
ncbi:anti-repressor SinI family protein [Metabacillus dongyingensis]